MPPKASKSIRFPLTVNGISWVCKTSKTITFTTFRNIQKSWIKYLIEPVVYCYFWSLFEKKSLKGIEKQYPALQKKTVEIKTAEKDSRKQRRPEIMTSKTKTAEKKTSKQRRPEKKTAGNKDGRKKDVRTGSSECNFTVYWGSEKDGRIKKTSEIKTAGKNGQNKGGRK